MTCSNCGKSTFFGILRTVYFVIGDAPNKKKKGVQWETTDLKLCIKCDDKVITKSQKEEKHK